MRNAPCVARLLAAAALAAAPSAAWADRVIADLEATATGVVVRFSCPLRYVAHFPARSGSEVRIDLQPMPGCSLTGAERELVPVADGTRSAVTDAEFELVGGVRPSLTLHFARALEFELRPQPGFGAIEVHFERRAAQSRIEPAEPSPRASRPALRPLPPAAQVESEFEAARQALLKKDYDAAIRLYTKLLEYPEHPWRARAQEYLGLARERKKQFAQARAEYEEYLRHYPEAEGVPRVQQRLAALVTLDRRRGQGGPLPGDPDASPWAWSAGVSQLYRTDQLTFDDGVVKTDAPKAAAVVTDADLNLRRRGESIDFQSRLSGGYLYDAGDDTGGTSSSRTPTRLSAAWAEWNDRAHGWSTRLGRQSRSSGGIYGLYDGVYAGWRARPKLRLNFLGGFPRDTSRAEFDTDRKFAAVSADWLGVADGLDLSFYVLDQRIGSFEDRRALGTELRWYRPGRTALALVDYDVYYNVLNAVVAQTTWDLPGRWTVNGTVDHRRSPFLSTRNALIGQPVTDLEALLPAFGEAGLKQLAEDRTAQSDFWSFGVTRPVGDRWQVSADVSGAKYDDLPASGGVAALPSNGTEMQYSVQALGNGFIRDSDLHVFGVRHGSNSISTSDSVFWSARFPLFGGLRLGPRLRYDRRSVTTSSSDLDVYSGALNGDWRFRKGSLEFEAGTEWSTQTFPIDEQKIRRTWFSLGYRVFF
jgi:hypothetical protein